MLAKDLMNEEVITVNPDDSIADIGNLLLEKKKSAAVVLKDDNIIGMVSKEGFVLSVRDLIGKRFDETYVREYMDKKVETIDENAEIKDVVNALLELPYRIERLPVTREGKLVGIISKGDVVKLFAEQMAGRFKVKDLMEYKPSMVESYSTLKDVIKEIEISGEKRVFVKSGKSIVGVITILDLACILFGKMKEKTMNDLLADMKAADFVSENLFDIGEEEDAAEAARVMIEKHIGGMPVVERDIKGVITKANIVKGYKLAITD